MYFRETPFQGNKFVLDFSDSNQNVNSIEFEKNIPYVIATLNCKLKNESTIYTHSAENKKAISDLSTKSRILLDKGSDHFCDIDHLNLTFSPLNQNYEIVDLRNNFYFERTKKI